MSLLNCEIYQRGRVSRIADTELILLITHLIRPPGSNPGVERVRYTQQQQHDFRMQMHNYCLIFIILYFKFVLVKYVIYFGR